MSVATSMYKAVRHQVSNLGKLKKGIPVAPSPLTSMTLDYDDVELARTWLQDRQSWFDESPVAEFETSFAEWNGSRHAIAFMNGRSALSACIAALNLRPGDEVLVAGYTCVVVPNAFKFAGVVPRYVDIELDTFGIDAGGLERHVSSKTKAILIQHLYGYVCRDFETLLRFAATHDLKIIEDCAHSTGAEFRGVKVGNFGHAAFYSTEQSKVLNTVQGGLAVTNHDWIADGLRKYANSRARQSEDQIDRQLNTLVFNYYRFKHPKRWLLGDYYAVKLGGKRLVTTTPAELEGRKPDCYGCRMVAPVASLGLNQLRKLDAYNDQRRRNSVRWDEWCDKHNVSRPVVLKHSTPICLRYPVLLSAREKADTSWARETLGIELGVWFRTQIHPIESDIPACKRAKEAVLRCVNFPTLF